MQHQPTTSGITYLIHLVLTVITPYLISKTNTVRMERSCPTSPTTNKYVPRMLALISTVFYFLWSHLARRLSLSRLLWYFALVVTKPKLFCAKIHWQCNKRIDSFTIMLVLSALLFLAMLIFAWRTTAFFFSCHASYWLCSAWWWYEKHCTFCKIRIQQIVSKSIAEKLDSANIQQKNRPKIRFSKYSAKKFGIQQIFSKNDDGPNGFSKLSANFSLKSQQSAIEALNGNYFSFTAGQISIFLKAPALLAG